MRVIPAAAMVFSLIVSASASAAPCDGFVDVDDGNAEFCTAVKFMKNKGITLGCTDASHYCPNANVTRLQMALFLQRMGKGGPNNTLGNYTTTIGGGDFNLVGDTYSTVGGGYGNTASFDYSTVAGGYSNTASGFASFAAGTRARANHHYSFVWGGDPNNDTVSQESGDFVVYAPGKVLLYAGAIGAGGCVLTDGTTGWICSSDRNLKENFVALDGRDILRRLSSIPVTRWNAKAVPNVQHIGPMAQDFYAAFGLGTDSLGIGTTDAQGVAFAAIQGLHQLVQEKDAKIEAQQRRITELEDRIAQVESLRGELASLRAAVAELREDRASVAVTTK